MKLFAWFFCLSLLVVSYPPAFAADQKVTGEITRIFTGHEKDLFGVHIGAPQINPSGNPDCNQPGYATDSDQPGYRTFYAAVLLAFTMRATVEVVVDDEGCVAGRPKLIGVNILGCNTC
jgi:hypothetical protein